MEKNQETSACGFELREKGTSMVWSRALGWSAGLLAMAGVALGAGGKIAWLEISDEPTERPSELAWLVGSHESPTLRNIVDAIERIADDEEYAGLVIRLKDAELHAAQVEELGRAIEHVRKADKKVHVFGESFGGPDLMLASYADEVIAQRGGEISLPGIYMEEMFLADTLAWAGVKADMVQVGDYKGAAEQMSRSSPSEAWEKNITQLLDSMYGHLREPIKQGRKLSDSQLDAAMAEAWMADASEGVKLGLLDAEADLPGLTDYLKKEYGKDIEIEKVEAGEPAKGGLESGNPFAMLAMLSKQPETKPKGPSIAVLHIDAEIVDGESKGGLRGGSVGSRTIRNALEDILHEDLIKGVVVRIDSPGGSATASEVIWQGVRRVAEAKPVWVSVGGMAASGGYYIAVAGDRIFVNPSSIVGSIGVVGGKMSLAGLYEKLQVHVVSRARGPRAGMLESNTPWTADDLRLVRSKMTSTYDQFTRRVAAGRKGIDLSKTAEGRLFTGDKAIGMQMADEIGGLDDAIEKLAGTLNLSDFGVVDYPAPRPISEVIEDTLRSFVMAPSLKAPETGATMERLISEVVGTRAWKQLSPQFRAFMLMREEPVLLVAPKAIVWK